MLLVLIWSENMKQHKCRQQWPPEATKATGDFKSLKISALCVFMLGWSLGKWRSVFIFNTLRYFFNFVVFRLVTNCNLHYIDNVNSCKCLTVSELATPPPRFIEGMCCPTPPLKNFFSIFSDFRDRNFLIPPLGG